MRPAPQHIYGQPPGVRYMPPPVPHLHPPPHPGYGRGGHALAVAQGPDQGHPIMQQQHHQQQQQHQLYSSMPTMGIPIGSPGIPLQYDYTPSSLAREVSQQPWPPSFIQTRPQWGPRVDHSGPPRQLNGPFLNTNAQSNGPFLNTNAQSNGPFLNTNAHHNAPYVYHPSPETSADRTTGNGRSNFTGMGRGRGVSSDRRGSTMKDSTKDAMKDSTKDLTKDSQPSSSRPLQGPIVYSEKSLRCEACAKTFYVPDQLEAHITSHIPCDEPNCSFSSSGKMMKEHKLVVHGKRSVPLSEKALKAAAKETEDDVRRWREERKRNYPTALNIQQKAERAKLESKELIEDAKLRRQRLKEILHRQAELGVPVADIPSSYMSDHSAADNSKLPNKNQNKTDNVPSSANTLSNQMCTPTKALKRDAEQNETQDEEQGERPSKIARINLEPSSDLVNGSSTSSELAVLEDSKVSKGSQCLQEDALTNGTVGAVALLDHVDGKPTVPEKVSGSELPRTHFDQPCYFFLRGHCKKGTRCHFLHGQQPHAKSGDVTAGAKSRDETAGAKSGDETAGAKSRDETAGAKSGDETADISREGKQKGGVSTLLVKVSGSKQIDKSCILECLRFIVKNSFLLEWPTKPLEFFVQVKEDAGNGREEEEASSPVDILAADATNLINQIDASDAQIDQIDPLRWPPSATVGTVESIEEEGKRSSV